MHPKTAKGQARTFRLPEDLDRYLDEAARVTDKSVSEIVREAMRMHRIGGDTSPSRTGAANDAKLAELVAQQADEISSLRSELSAMADVLGSTHRQVDGLRRSVGGMFNMMQALCDSLGMSRPQGSSSTQEDSSGAVDSAIVSTESTAAGLKPDGNVAAEAPGRIVSVRRTRLERRRSGDDDRVQLTNSWT